MYLVFTRMPVESYRGQLRSLLLCLCDVFRALINRNEFFTLRTYCTNKGCFCLFFCVFCHLSNDIKKVSVIILLSSPDNQRLYVILTLQTFFSDKISNICQNRLEQSIVKCTYRHLQSSKDIQKRQKIVWKIQAKIIRRAKIYNSALHHMSS